MVYSQTRIQSSDGLAYASAMFLSELFVMNGSAFLSVKYVTPIPVTSVQYEKEIILTNTGLPIRLQLKPKASDTNIKIFQKLIKFFLSSSLGQMIAGAIVTVRNSS